MRTHRPRHQPASSRHETVIALAVLSLIAGTGGLAGESLRPKSVTEAVPQAIAEGWLACLVLGAIGLLWSMLKHDRLDALLIEWPAFLLIGAGGLVYGACLAASGSGSGFVAMTTYLIYGGACIWRAVRIRLYLRYLRSATSE